MGRKSKYSEPMTSTEKAREYRQRNKNGDKKEITLRINDSVLKRIDEMVQFYELPSRVTLVEGLLKKPLVEAVEVMQSFQKERFNRFGNADLPEQAEAMLKMTKALMWSALVNGVSDDAHTVLKGLQSKLDSEEEQK